MAVENYRLPLWEDTPDYVEVFVEKEGLAGIIEQITDEYDVPLLPVKGYNSLTAMWEAAERYKKRAEQNITVYVLGDFDPSGADAPEVYGREICALLPETINLKFTRLAMTEDDLARPKYAVAVRETKIKDPRAKKHVAKYGLMSSLELDAMAPDALRAMIRAAIETHVDGARLKCATGDGGAGPRTAKGNRQKGGEAGLRCFRNNKPKSIGLCRSWNAPTIDLWPVLKRP
jgi:hypothetical protein